MAYTRNPSDLEGLMFSSGPASYSRAPGAVKPSPSPIQPTKSTAANGISPTVGYSTAIKRTTPNKAFAARPNPSGSIDKVLAGQQAIKDKEAPFAKVMTPEDTARLTGVTYADDPLDMTGWGEYQQFMKLHGGDMLVPSKIDKEADSAIEQLKGAGALDNYMKTAAPALEKNQNAQGAFDLLMNEAKNPMAVPNNQQKGFDEFNMAAPDLSTYYDRQAQKTQQRLDRAFAARGMYGSSEATNNISDAMQGLAAEQANREADYNLARDAARRGWAEGADTQGLGIFNARTGQLENLSRAGTAADASGINAYRAGADVAQGVDRNAIDRALGIGTIAGQVDDTDLKRWASTVDATLGNQVSHENRATQTLDNTMKIPNTVSQWVQPSINGATQADVDSLMQQIELSLGISKSQLDSMLREQGIDAQNTQAAFAALRDIGDSALKVKGLLPASGTATSSTAIAPAPPPDGTPGKTVFKSQTAPKKSGTGKG